MGFGGLGMGEMVLIFLVVLLLFGAKRLPEIGSSLGKGIREFKGSLREIENEIKAEERRAALRPSEDTVRTASPRKVEEPAESQVETSEDQGEPRRLTTNADA